MTRPSRVDANQFEIVDALRTIGASVQHLHQVGGGCPDLLVGFRGRNVLLEVKVPKGKLNELQEDWFQAWRGQAHVVRSVDEAIRSVTEQTK